LGVKIDRSEAAAFGEVAETSALMSVGLEELGGIIAGMFNAGDLAPDETIVTSKRHKAALVAARRGLRDTLSAIDSRLSAEFYSIGLTDAWQSLGEITGQTADGGLIDRIFSEFCVGK
jgi:tRNA modification GTPase